MNIESIVIKHGDYEMAELHVQKIYDFLKSHGGTDVLPKDLQSLSKEISSELAFLAFDENLLVGYQALGIWKNCQWTEIRSGVVHPDYRRHGLGTKLRDKMIKVSKIKFPGWPIICLAGKMSQNIYLKMGFAEKNKSELPPDFWEICPGSCGEWKDFPNCHCRALVLT